MQHPPEPRTSPTAWIRYLLRIDSAGHPTPRPGRPCPKCIDQAERDFQRDDAWLLRADACEYCNRDDVTLYAWHADTWCANCLTEYAERTPLELHGTLDNAPQGRPKHPTYAQPFVWQEPDGSVRRGIVRE